METNEEDTMQKAKDAMQSLLALNRAYPYGPQGAEEAALEKFVEAMAKEIGRRLGDRHAATRPE